MMRGYTATDAYKMALVWGVAAALLAIILTRGFLPSALVVVAAMLAFAGVILVAYRMAAVGVAEISREAAKTGEAQVAHMPAAAASPTSTAPVTTEATPALLAEKPAGGGDDLKRIRGIGPKLETQLNAMGVYLFDQIAAWTPAEIAWVDSNLEGFKGRVSRDDWVAQARVLATGETTAFAARVDRGEVASSQG